MKNKNIKIYHATSNEEKLVTASHEFSHGKLLLIFKLLVKP